MPPGCFPCCTVSLLSKLFGISRSSSPQPPLKNSDSDRVCQVAASNIPAPTAAPLQTGHINDTPITIDVLPTSNLNQPLSSISGHGPQSPVHRSLQHGCSSLDLARVALPHTGTAITHQHIQPHPTHPTYQPYPVDQLYHSPYRSHHTSHQYNQAENAMELQTLSQQQRSMFHPSNARPNKPPSHWQDMNPGSFNQAHDFVINHATFINNSSDNFMALLLEATIKGAEFDSSDRHMPLRCHPGTRVDIIKRCQDFVLNQEGRPSIRWVVGVAGVGKSAIMQSIAHNHSNALSDIIVGATIFFSINERQDGTKAITTIAYQLAVKLKPYYRFAQREVTHDPSLLRKSLSRQFDKFIVEPFIHHQLLDRSSRLLIIIDGLDECDNRTIQQELLGLISDFCIAYPTSPIVWLIASRPEPHITLFFDQPKVALAYEKEEILVDADDACEDVKRYLHDKFREIQMASIPLQGLPQWPPEDDLLTVARASGGLFAYASTVVRYINDSDYGDPVPLLDDVIDIIKTGTKENLWGRNHPMAQLDALYSHIMSKIPTNVMAYTRKLFLLTGFDGWKLPSFRLLCNILGMSENTAYGATHHIRAIAKVPGPTEAAVDSLEFFHKSFYDYLRDFERSGFSIDFDSEAEEIYNQAVLRILEQAPDGVYMYDARKYDLSLNCGILKNGPGTGENISVSWPDRMDDNSKLRLYMFRQAVDALVQGFTMGEGAFRSLLGMRVLTTCFSEYFMNFPMDIVEDFTFDDLRRRELLEQGILKKVTLPTVDYNKIMFFLRLRLRGPAFELSNPWSVDCIHEWEGQGQDWSTDFALSGSSWQDLECRFCSDRFDHHIKAQQPGHLFTVLTLSPQDRMIEFRFVDPDDGVSEWIYHFGIKERAAQHSKVKKAEGHGNEEGKK